jgi:hypothetical protein
MERVQHLPTIYLWPAPTPKLCECGLCVCVCSSVCVNGFLLGRFCGPPLKEDYSKVFHWRIPAQFHATQNKRAASTHKHTNTPTHTLQAIIKSSLLYRYEMNRLGRSLGLGGVIRTSQFANRRLNATTATTTTKSAAAAPPSFPKVEWTGYLSEWKGNEGATPMGSKRKFKTPKRR